MAQAARLLADAWEQPDSQDDGEIFPSEHLREKLHYLGIGLIFHEKACLLAMIERRTGILLPEDRTPDQLAALLIDLHKQKTRKFVESTLRQPLLQ